MLLRLSLPSGLDSSMKRWKNAVALNGVGGSPAFDGSTFPSRSRKTIAWSCVATMNWCPTASIGSTPSTGTLNCLRSAGDASPIALVSFEVSRRYVRIPFAVGLQPRPGCLLLAQEFGEFVGHLRHDGRGRLQHRPFRSEQPNACGLQSPTVDPEVACAVPSRGDDAGAPAGDLHVRQSDTGDFAVARQVGTVTPDDDFEVAVGGAQTSDRIRMDVGLPGGDRESG